MRTCENCQYWAPITPAVGKCVKNAEPGKVRVTWDDSKCDKFKKKEDKI